MPKYCCAPNCPITRGRLSEDNRLVRFYKRAFPLKDGPWLQAWLWHMGCEHWGPNCHQHLCSEHFTPSCFQWRYGVLYLRLDAVPSIFSGAPTIKKQQTVRTPGPMHLVMLGPASGDLEATATKFLSPLIISPAPAGPHPGVPAKHPRAGLGSALGGLQQRLVQRLQRCQERQRVQLWALEELAQQLCRESLVVQARGGLLRRVTAQLFGPEESHVFIIICGEPDIVVVLAQGPAPPTLDAKPEPLDTQTTSA
ncbi:LOW QUALITY PROTEIN: THAP domain-containing protein 8 [Rousettus aegyptiacus]|uniref:LOW QUALITY PROTEIN: THAP domain-containing protein 8 n=1 Tax=Rousettus aegyptiacus TaxID=9407 RepID=UPI00168CF5C7|nr:LOW QUALITY PROTEIN: THAP domain-containing protein 8 [Rousettus aegyptiacus]